MSVAPRWESSCTRKGTSSPTYAHQYTPTLDMGQCATMPKDSSIGLHQVVAQRFYVGALGAHAMSLSWDAKPAYPYAGQCGYGHVRGLL
ncbi:hypothetical protein RJT34_23081 [Clitoria ternatea]|uniref:Uncharacterized protein n=1 Tax=Clitoria ternatea TaxID=43366 RepID=A0AAN9FLV5_CLITE